MMLDWNEYHKEKELDMTLHTIGPDVSSSDAAPTAGDMKPTNPSAFASGRRSLDRSVWYNGWLLTFLATGEETQGQFALIEAVGRRGMFRLRTSITGKMRSPMYWRARSSSRSPIA